MIRHFFGLVFFMAFLTTACSPRVNTNEASDVNFSEFDTYAYLPSGDSAEFRTVLDEKIVREVNQQMEARDYELDNQNPDLLVLVKTMFEEEEMLEREPILTSYNYYSPGFYAGRTLGPGYYQNYSTIASVAPYGGAIRQIEYTEGTFVVDVIDASNNQIVWRGWSETPVDRANLDESIRDYIDNIFAEFPVEP